MKLGMMHMSDGRRNAVAAMARVGAVIVLLAGGAMSGCSNRPRSNPAEDRQRSLGEAVTLANRGQSAMKAGEYTKAIELFTQSIQAAPDFGASWHELGLAHMKRGVDDDYMKAGQALQRAASLMPTDPKPLRNLGILYQQRGFEAEALKHFEDALLIAPNDIDSLRGAAASVKLLKKTDAITLDMLKRAQMIETDPTWRDLIMRERIRVENELEERLKG
jgi:tetratricopeptide (TPR) repeat protein